MATKKQPKKKTKKILSIVAAAVISLALVGSITTLFVKLDRQTETERIGGEAYAVGTIDAEGAYAEGDTAIYMKKAITTDGLRCELEEDAKIEYQLFFYDKDDKFISATEKLTADYDGAATPEGAESVKIMITPTADEDGKVSLVEVLGYASQLTVIVNR